ncbi:uncharacterized protein LOC144383555 isoform X2 [Gasterosteus aculeatus]
MQTQGFVALVSISASLLVVGIMLERRKGMSHLYKELETADLETKAEELAGKEHEHTEIEANLKSEHDAWNQEIANLRAQATGYRQICDFVKDDPTVKKMCGTKQETLLRRR